MITVLRYSGEPFLSVNIFRYRKNNFYIGTRLFERSIKICYTFNRKESSIIFGEECYKIKETIRGTVYSYATQIS